MLRGRARAGVVGCGRRCRVPQDGAENGKRHLGQRVGAMFGAVGGRGQAAWWRVVVAVFGGSVSGQHVQQHCNLLWRGTQHAGGTISTFSFSVQDNAGLRKGEHKQQAAMAL